MDIFIINNIQYNNFLINKKPIFFTKKPKKSQKKTTTNKPFFKFF